MHSSRESYADKNCKEINMIRLLVKQDLVPTLAYVEIVLQLSVGINM